MKAIKVCFMHVMVAVLFFFTFTGTSYANDNVSDSARIEKASPELKGINIITRPASQAKTIELLILTGKSEKVNIRLSDEEGRLLWKDKSKHSRFASKIDLSQLRNGFYTLSFSGNNSEIIQPFEVVDDIVLLNEREKLEFGSLTRSSNRKFSKINLLVNVPGGVILEVFDANGVRTFNESFASETIVSRDMDIYFLGEGRFTIKVQTPSRSILKNIEIK